MPDQAHPRAILAIAAELADRFDSFERAVANYRLHRQIINDHFDRMRDEALIKLGFIDDPEGL